MHTNLRQLGQEEHDRQTVTASTVKMRRICDQCSARRFRCDRKQPCGSCQRRLFICHYSPFAQRKPRIVPVKNKLEGYHAFILSTDKPEPTSTPSIPAPSQALTPPSRPRSSHSASSASPETSRSQSPKSPDSVATNEASVGLVSKTAHELQRSFRVAEHFIHSIFGQSNAFLSQPFGLFMDPTRAPVHRALAAALTTHDAHSGIPPAVSVAKEILYHPGLVYPLLHHFFDSFVRVKPCWQRQHFFRRLASGQVPMCLLSSMIAYSAQLYPCEEEHRPFLQMCIAEHTTRAEHYVWEELENSTLDTISSSLLLTVIACNYCNGDKLDTYGSLAIRQCFMSNLHAIDSPYQGQDVVVRKGSQGRFADLLREIKRRITWGIFFIGNIAALLGKVSYLMDLDSIDIKPTSDKELYSLLPLANNRQYDDELPCLIWPILNTSCGYGHAYPLIRMASQVTVMRRNRVRGEEVPLDDILAVNHQLRIWRQTLPEELKLPRHQPGQQYDKNSPVVQHGLTHLLYYLCVFYTNSTLLLDPLPDCPQVRECRIFPTTEFLSICHEIMLPATELPIALRPLNSFFYGFYGFQACVMNKAKCPSLDISADLALLDCLYQQLSDYVKHSKFSAALMVAFLNMLDEHSIDWKPLAHKHVHELSDVQEGSKGCATDDP
ncbi:hypothetical protein H4R35_001614 [Dimargaris xerosporica]|nr:hypothetical protein H4R35_001614 [Dimargaris xerosporica]